MTVLLGPQVHGQIFLFERRNSRKQFRLRILRNNAVCLSKSRATVFARSKRLSQTFRALLVKIAPIRSFDGFTLSSYNDRVISPSGLAEICERLEARQLPQGAWAYRSGTQQAALEPTCLALLALESFGLSVWDNGARFLVRTQNPNGSWPAFEGDDMRGSWTTALALLVLRTSSEHADALDKGWRWLLQSKGRESNWFWKWKFRTADRHVQFDPDKYGWPWIADTNSWVVPTAVSLIALKQRLRTTCDPNSRVRMERGISMLLDRTCPGGGWNAGNGVVYGEPLAAHPDATALALLALAGEQSDSVVNRSLSWLEESIRECDAPWSLAWAAMALTAHGRSAVAPLRRLADTTVAHDADDAATLAAVVLAHKSEAGSHLFR